MQPQIPIVRSTKDNNGYLKKIQNQILAFHKHIDSTYQPVSESDADFDYSEKPYIAFIAMVDQVPVGAVLGRLILTPVDRSVPHAGLQAVWVDDQYRGKGIAHMLVEAFEKEVRACGAHYVDLHVDIRNPLAVTLWNDEGYQTYQERRKKELL